MSFGRLCALTLLGALAAVPSPAAAGPRWRFAHLTARDGLPNNAVYGLFQDRHGYVWIATETGVCRFDGRSCRPFGVTDGLADPVARAFAEDRDGRLWVATEAGVSRFDGERFESFGPSHGLPHRQVYAALRRRDGSLWFGTGRGLARWNDGRFAAFAEGLPEEARIWALAEDGGGRLWVGTRGAGLFTLDGHRFVPSPEPLPDPNVFGLATAPDGALWAGTSGGLVRTGPGRRTFGREQGLPTERTGAVVVEPSGRAWFGMFGGGLGRIVGEDVEVFGREAGVPDVHLTALLVDHEGNVWCGTRSSGVFRLGNPALAHWGGPGSVVRGRVSGLGRSSDGRLWIGSIEGGLASVDRQGNAVSDRRLPEGVWALDVGADDAIWAATYEHVVRIEGARVQRFGRETTGARERITAIHDDGTGRVWLGSYTASHSGLIRWDGSGFRRFSREDGFVHDEITSFATDRAGRLWIGAYGGLTRYDGRGFTSFDQGDGLPCRTVTAVIEDAAGRLWVGTDAGLCLFDGTCRRLLTAADGLPSNLVRSLAVRGGRLYVGTAGGLAVVESDRVHAITAADGLMSDDLSHDVLLAGDDVWFGTNEHAVRWRESGMPSPPVPRLLLTRWTAGGRTVSLPARAGVEEEIEAGAVDVVFGFAGLSYRREGPVLYRTRLEGLDDAWSEPSSHAEARYTHLPPGRYRFAVQAAAGGDWSAPAEVAFRVAPHWWQSAWLLAAALGLVAAGGRAGWRWREARLRVAHEQRIDQLRRDQEQRLLALRELLERARAVTGQLDRARLLQRLAHEAAELAGARPSAVAVPQDHGLRIVWEWDGDRWQLRNTVRAEASPPPGALHATVRHQDGPPVAIVEVRRPEGAAAFTPIQEQLVQALADQAAPALQTAELYRELEGKNVELSAKNVVIAEAMRELEGLYRREQEASRSLSELGRMKSDLIVLASHELRTPLTVLRGYTEAWSSGLVGGAAAQQRAIEASARMVDRMVAVVDEIIEALRIDEGGVRVRRGRVELSELIARVADDLRTFAEARGQKLALEVAGPLVVQGDWPRLELVLTNVVQNAIKFTPDGGRIVVRAIEREGSAFVEVEDTGVGVEEAQLERIFERFHTGPDLERHGSGSFSFLGRGPGLGLAIARSYVDAHGGRIWCESAGPGRGSVFRIVLPVAEGLATLPPRTAGASDAGAAARPAQPEGQG